MTNIEQQKEGNRAHLVERFPYGIAMLWSTMLVSDSGGRFGAYIPDEMMEYTIPFFQRMRPFDPVVRSSTVTDIVEYACNKIMMRPFLKRIIPFRPWFVDSLQALPQEKQQFFLSFLGGSDFDFHIRIHSEEEIDVWAQSLIRALKEIYRVEPRVHHNEKLHIAEFFLDSHIIRAWNRLDVRQYSKVTSSFFATTVLRVTWGVWDSGIPFCEYTIIARFSQVQEDMRDDVILFSLGVSPSEGSLPPEMEQKNTRLPPNANTWDTRAHAQVFFERPDDFRYEHALNLPVFFVSPGDLRVLDNEMTFGEAFGEGNPGDAFDELLRVIRKTLRYMDAESIPAAFASIQAKWTAKATEKNLHAHIRACIAQDPYRKHVCMRELLTMAFYAPRELGEIGTLLGFEKIIPGWETFSSIAATLPPKEKMKEGIIVDADPLLYGPVGTSGWAEILSAGKKRGMIGRGCVPLEFLYALFEIA